MQSPSKFQISLFKGSEASRGQYVTDVVETDFKSIDQLTTSHSWSPSLFLETMTESGEVKRNRRIIHFSKAHVFAVDIDENLSLVDGIEIVKSLGYQAIVGTTRNHQKEKWNKQKTKSKPACDRFRIIFFLKTPIKSDVEYRAVFQSFKAIFPMCDENCTDSSRFFYPFTEIIHKNDGHFYEIDNIVNNSINHIKSSDMKIKYKRDIKGFLNTETLKFIAHGAPDGEWHKRRTKALFDLKQQGYSIEEATIQIRKASQSAHGELDETDFYQINDIYNNRDVVYSPRLQNFQDGPQPLFRELPAAKPYPIESLGNILGPAVRSLANTSKAPLAMCAQSVLAAATLAVQPHRNVCIDGRTYPISQFFVTIGESGERKSAVDNEALKSHREHERTQLTFTDRELLQFNNEKEAFDNQRKKILNNKKLSKEEVTNELNKLGLPPTPPLSRIMLIQEPTFEGLLKLYENGQPSIGLFSDEGGRMLGGHSMNADNQLKTMAGFCTLWDGKPISKVRAEEGSKNFYGKRFSLHLMVQPLVAQQLTGNSLATDQGLLSRCLFSYPESTVGRRLYTEANYNDINMVKYHWTMSAILNAKLPIVEGSKNELQPEKIELDCDAKMEWTEFHDYVEKNLSENGIFYTIRSFGAKAAEHALRMAAVLTLSENLKAPFIDKNKMKSAIELIHFYLSEALRLSSVSSVNPELIQADKLLRWCYKQSEFIYISLVYNKGPNSMRDKKTAENMIKILVDHGHLFPIDGGMNLDGKHRKQVWQVIRP